MTSFYKLSDYVFRFNCFVYGFYFPLLPDVVDVGSLNDVGKENDDKESDDGGMRLEL